MNTSRRFVHSFRRSLFVPISGLCTAMLLPTIARADVLFSEYVEGSSNNKALEIFNRGATTWDLAAENCEVQFYFNGNSSPGISIALTGSIAAGDVHVLMHSSTDPTWLGLADQLAGGSWFNGDDAVVLRCGGDILDVIGQVGVDPGTEWGSGSTTTANHTLRRINGIVSGDTIANDSFDPTEEWVGFPQNTFEGLGQPGEGVVDPGDVECDDPSAIAIGSIQGDDSASPFAGDGISRIVQGTVIADFEGNSAMRGFFIQDAGDGDAATSDGIFIYNADVDSVDVGDVVAIQGTVSEYFDQTQITAQAIAICGTAALPAVQDLTLPKPLPMAGVDAWERLEGMLVEPQADLFVTEIYQLYRYGQFAVSANNRLFQGTEVATPGAAANAVEEANARNYLFVDDASDSQNRFPTEFPAPGLSATNTLRAGTQVDDLRGVLNEAFGAFRIRPTQAPNFIDTNPRPSAAPTLDDEQLRVASFNVLNYFTTIDTGASSCGPGLVGCRGADSAIELTRQRDKLIPALARLNAAGGSEDCSEYAAVDPGGYLGDDAIAVGLMYCTDTVSQTSGSHAAMLDDSVASTLRLGAAVEFPIFNGVNSNRAALVVNLQELRSGARLDVVVTHLKSKGVTAAQQSSCASDPSDENCDHGDGQGFWNKRRSDAARAILAWLDTAPTGAETPYHLVLGDLNAYLKEDPIQVFVDAGYQDLASAFAGAPSYVFDGRWGALDHALASPSLIAHVSGAQCDRSQADEPSALDYNEEFKSAAAASALYNADPFRASDHNPILVGLHLPEDAVPAPATSPFALLFLIAGLGASIRHIRARKNA